MNEVEVFTYASLLSILVVWIMLTTGSIEHEPSPYTNRIIELTTENERLQEAVRVLSGSANGWVDYCMLNDLMPSPLAKDKTLDTQCREAIAKEALNAKA